MAFKELLAQAGESVIVTVPRANVREAPTTDSRVVMQLTAGTTVALQGVEGDWYKVRIGMGGVQFEAYIAKSVSAIVATPAGAATGGDARGAGAADVGAAATVHDGMSVAWQADGASRWLTPETTGVIIVPGRPNSIEAVATALPSPEAPPPSAAGAPVTFAWTLPAVTRGPDVADKRPTFVVQMQDVPRMDAAKLTAEIVRLVPAVSGVQVVAGVPGRADQAIWGDSDWEVMRTLQQRSVRSDTEVLAPGAIRLRPAADLPLGTYAVVVRPIARDRLAGADVLRGQREGVVFAVAWPFTVR
jgi:hypothetical protein